MLGGGLPRGVVTILTSQSSAAGKTSFATSILCSTLHQPEIRSLIFFLEGSVRTLGIRMLSIEAGLDLRKIRTVSLSAKEFRCLQEAGERIRKGRVWIDARSLSSVATMRAQIAQAFGDAFPDLLIIDSLNLMAVDGYGQILADLKLLAHDSQAAILVVAHTLNKHLPEEMMARHAHTLLILHRLQHESDARLEIDQGTCTPRTILLSFSSPTGRFIEQEQEFQPAYHETQEP
jgi:replicative DNA helicase